MNCLSLYVEKWSIVGAICTGNGLQRIGLPNGEDRAWLYFFEDIANDRIFYGKNNKRGAQNREPHYYQDVFASIVDSEAKFKKFGRDYPLAEIFKYSNILDDLKTAYAEWAGDEKIPTYVSFSKDISYNAQSLFKEQLEKNGFVIKQYAGKIEFLAMEWLSRTNRLHLAEGKMALVLKSTNENLHMSVYSTDGKLLVENINDSLLGYGNDVRRHAVIEDVIHQGNSTLRFLTTQEEIDHEMKRMEDFVEEWILRLDSGRPGIPVRITDINFSLAPDNKFTANLKGKTIDERTKAIIRTIIDYVKKFVIDKAGIHEYDLGAVVLIGNSFENNQYFREIDQWLQINESNMFKITEAKLPDVVSVYSQIPEDYFSSEERFFGTESQHEKDLQAKNEAERIERQKAEAEMAQKRQTEEEKTRSEKAYKDAMTQYYEAENKKDFANMREFLLIALSKKPNDAIATQRLAELDDAVRKEDLKSEQYKTAITTADKFFEEGDIDNALSFYTQALTIDANSAHAKERIKEIRKMRDDAQKAKECITKAEVFEGQKLYPQALTELNKARLLDPNNSEISKKIEEIEGHINAIKQKLSALKALLTSAEAAGNYTAAIEACRELASLDAGNSTKWERKSGDLEKKKEREDEKARLLAECKKIVDDASFKDEWEKVLAAAQKALPYDPTNEFFLKYQTKAIAEIDKTKQPINYPPKPPRVDPPKPPKGPDVKGGESGWDWGKPDKGGSKGGGSGSDFFDDSKKTTKAPKVDDDFFGTGKASQTGKTPPKNAPKKTKDLDGWDF